MLPPYRGRLSSPPIHYSIYHIPHTNPAAGRGFTTPRRVLLNHQHTPPLIPHPRQPALGEWAGKIQSSGSAWRDTYDYFKHEEAGTGPAFARQLEALLPR